ncbi:TPA: hypothetical protein QE967_002430 [Staphylococcus aureus]|uniref:hypothetical protein n=1 Tax=Staphylococcus aureus TaxID=1280 RepID=UPI00085C8F61|nr:hypothetical protein [Staphylococcus aureus]MBH4619014.1 hypothetical protein [Staphylococcus aureus]MBH4623727.1 hypothetical protein [Staphylococcus aureus]SCU48516.1 phage protein [Staphylococcus aureus]HDT6968589.1 hypothetical protein [Staphylococcus aureus]
MPMSKTQALEIIKKVRYVYNIDFDKPKLEMWIDVLSQNGDYQPTVKAVDGYINSNNPYPPNLPAIMRKAPKKVSIEPVDDETATHQWKMQNDPEYVRQRKIALDNFMNKLAEFGGDNE